MRGWVPSHVDVHVVVCPVVLRVLAVVVEGVDGSGGAVVTAVAMLVTGPGPRPGAPCGRTR